MITSAFLERAQSTRNNPKKMCPLSNKILLSPLLLGEVSASTLQGLKGIRMLPSRGLVQPMDILHRGPTHCARASDTSKFGSSKFLSTETNGQLLVHCIGSAEGRASSNLHSRFLLLRGLSSQPWKIYAGWWWSQLGDTLTRHQFLLWQSFDKTFTSKLSLCSFAALTYFGQWLLNKRRHEKNHKRKESKLRLNTTLPLLSRFRLTKAGRSNNYSAQTSGFFRCPLIFIFSLHHQPH